MLARVDAARRRFITFEGGEGAGKSTQVRLLADYLRSLGESVVTTREPGGSPRAEALREMILSGQGKPYGPFGEALLFSAARADHVRATIKPALERGAFVLCDRFADSTRAYQGTLGNLDPRLVRALERTVVAETRPGLTILLDLPAEEGLARAQARRSSEAPDRFEGEALEFHRSLRAAFLDMAEREPGRFAVIDAAKPVDVVAASVAAAVHRAYPALVASGGRQDG